MPIRYSYGTPRAYRCGVRHLEYDTCSAAGRELRRLHAESASSRGRQQAREQHTHTSVIGVQRRRSRGAASIH